MAKPKVTKKEVSQEFKLRELLGEKRVKELRASKILKAFRDDLATNMINEVIDRTQDNKNIRGGSFANYSKSYAKLKGVNRSDVDMTLKGAMLDSIRNVKSTALDSVKIKVGEGVNSKKAYNHQVGDTLPRRQFFGLLKKDAKELAESLYEQYTDDVAITEEDIEVEGGA